MTQCKTSYVGFPPTVGKNQKLPSNRFMTQKGNTTLARSKQVALAMCQQEPSKTAAVSIPNRNSNKTHQRAKMTYQHNFCLFFFSYQFPCRHGP